jgi:uncharacterized protein
MPNNVVHFAIHADNLDRARRFYSSVFGWRFTPWGPPDFYLVETGTSWDPGIRGALQKRESGAPAGGVNAFECTIAVDNVDAMARDITTAGGTILHGPMTIPGVGRVVQFRDSEGNVACAMQYDHPQT